MFKDVSSTSSDEEERDDLNIMDTEEDLARRLQCKLNESDGQQQENEGSNQIGMMPETPREGGCTVDGVVIWTLLGLCQNVQRIV